MSINKAMNKVLKPHQRRQPTHLRTSCLFKW